MHAYDAKHFDHQLYILPISNESLFAKFTTHQTYPLYGTQVQLYVYIRLLLSNPLCVYTVYVCMYIAVNRSLVYVYCVGIAINRFLPIAC